MLLGGFFVRQYSQDCPVSSTCPLADELARRGVAILLSLLN
ncbi:hypothetical protein HG15A2_03970 [Adhaeretor mobilis]|uniref:Uncharacterized protein n=1 Tax=Adhaeretor mobilis TaxID=1930276 RepID=A0A517MQT8_9BACT|nr:hypothetical protein HG15A2_03970 [Adhaeretor mobilis]